ncbi:hypothetical protein GKC30_14725 [Pseudodesulfovibrio sp. F-1]|uniref:Carrier domain-containing protein n=1 Tax=Pseudodesulfovibrio alkaliphilus TaxID=2661613 RepID=A0A7K1KS19_9BACT|nr:hypothetical protein [Pseudodesulfovibrio alkaliphilus]MUM78885.1 hypothetical protein [Pseudodesulfovibrio alkaliphilus]
MSTFPHATILNTSLTRAFSSIVRERTDQPALVQDGITITYGELDSLSTAMAMELIKLYPECPDMHPSLGSMQKSQEGLSVAPPLPVTCVYLPRSIENIVAFVAGAKAGVACAPTGVDWPDGSILSLFRTLLNKRDYSEEDSFLESGGSSIKAARLFAQVRRASVAPSNIVHILSKVEVA